MKKNFSEIYELKQETFIFFKIYPGSDILAFICPFLIAINKKEKLSKRVYNRLTAFLTKLNREYIAKNDRINGVKFLSHLHEPNEYFLGYSDKNKGKAVSIDKASEIFNSLRNNKFTRQGMGITNEAHNVLLLVKGIGQDNMSDIIANVCRDIFAEFTENVCKDLDIPTVSKTIEFYNPTIGAWDNKTANIPEHTGRKIILIPNTLVVGHKNYTAQYNRFISKNYLSKDILAGKLKDANGKMVRQLKDGSKKAIFKEIYRAYKKPKNELINFVLQYAGSLDEFLQYLKENYPNIDVNNIINELE